ncbi:MAG: hypothetical protein H7Z42_02445, partial [Roseiflexaceae bacterium]|nr:hypothetical protein [Roseiflexaceae bacterium]
WQAWRRGGGAGSAKKVSYWRGQRIEAAPQRRSFSAPRGSELWRSLVFLLIGGVLVLGALSMLVNYITF